MTATTNHRLKTDFDVIIVGAGMAGITAAILLAGQKKKILLIEKKSFPFHRVCGEYVSNEVLAFLLSIGFDPVAYRASKIRKLRISTPSGKNIFSTLDLGGFGLSRYTFDHALVQLAIKNGSEVLTSTRVTDVTFKQNSFVVTTNSGMQITAALVIGSYGKRDVLDKKLNRRFINSHTGYLGVKYHVNTDYPVDEIGLDNFEGGYCGIVRIEKEMYNICYLYKRSQHRPFDSIASLEDSILFKNPVIRNIFRNSTFLSTHPEVINEISFVPKKLIENHIIMCGDSAGLIAPLCGNGMSMAIHSAKLLCELIASSEILGSSEITMEKRKLLEENYRKLWNTNFSNRLFWGRALQCIFGNTALTGLAIQLIHSIPPAERWLISQTHGKIIQP